MYGVVTRNAEEVDWPEFDRAFYEVKDVSGRQVEPLENAVNMISCFGDNAAADAKPDLVPIDADGAPATRDQPYFDWAYICPNATDYREGLLELIEDVADANPAVRLDDVGFPRQGYCRCERCEAAFEASHLDDRDTWRASVITEFVADATDRIPGRVYLTLYPDPYPGHLYERAGLDLEAISSMVDEFVVPLYDLEYATTYWLEVIASGFADRLDVPFSIELYAVNVEVDNLVHATEVAAEYGEDVFYGYDAATARATLRRLAAEGGDGVVHGE